MRTARLIRTVALAGAALGSGAACASLVDIDNPGVIEAGRLDPVRDGRTFSLSARQNFASASARLLVFTAWFTGEAISAETFPRIAEFDRRDVSDENVELDGLWSSLSVARSSAERVIMGLAGTAGEESNIDIARAALFAAYSFLVMAETFCSGAVDTGPLIDTGEMLLRADEHFSRASETAEAAQLAGPASDRPEAADIASAALVGRARARLASGDHAGAIADAERVRAGFSYSLLYHSDGTTAGRLGNQIWFSTFSRGSLSIAAAFRDLNDPRVPVSPPTAQYPPFDGVTPFWTQQKYGTLGSPIRLASRLEADYIAAEARGPSAMLALIQSRRAANGQGPYTGPTDADAITAELMEQRAREFFLEGKRLGDIRRQPGRVPFVRPAGTPYHKPGFAPVGDQTCLPLPAREMAGMR